MTSYSSNGSADVIRLVEERVTRIEENQLRSAEIQAAQEAYRETLFSQIANVNESLKHVEDRMKENLEDAVNKITLMIDKISCEISTSRKEQTSLNERILNLEIERNSRMVFKAWVLKVAGVVTATGLIGLGTWFIQHLINQ